MSRTITLTVQQRDAQLVVYIPAHIAEEAQLVAGQAVKLTIPTASTETQTLEQMLENYDPEKFGGEVVTSPPVGREIIK